jgi:hypothetical protein
VLEGGGERHTAQVGGIAVENYLCQLVDPFDNDDVRSLSSLLSNCTDMLSV